MKDMGVKGLAAAFLTMAASLELGAMTYLELQAEMRNAADGSTVYLDSDVEYDGPMEVKNKTVTLAGQDGRRHVLKRAENYKGTPFVFEGTSGLTLADIVLDGNGEMGMPDEYVFVLESGKTLTLDAGSEIRNYKVHTEYGTISIRGGTLEMKDGAVIRDCENDGHGVAVALLAGGSKFNMSGGLITGCVGTPYYGSLDPEPYTGLWGNGVVYVEDVSSYFTMTGGVIAGNSSETGVAGVLNGSGYFQPGLSACVTNNVGGYANDVLLYYGYLVVQNQLGDFTGRMTIHTFIDPVDGAVVNTAKCWMKTSAVSVAGLGGISCEQYPEYAMDGTVLQDGWYPKWGYRVENQTQNTVGSLSAMIQNANNGDVLKVYGARPFPALEMKDGRNLTFVGAPGCRLLRNDVTPMLTVNNATIRFEDIVLDGNRNAVNRYEVDPMFMVSEGGTVCLGSGAIIENAASAYNVKYWSTQPTLFRIWGSGARLVMEDGAVIRNCEMSDGGYGLAVRIGDGNAYDPKPTFVMQGGAISNNVITGATDTGNGGIVYVYNGLFQMSGGMITGNSCPDAPSGVNVYNGTAELSGTAYIENNLPSSYPDLYLRNDSSVSARLVGDFKGRIGVSSCGGWSDSETGIVGTPGETTGACRIFNAVDSGFGYAYGALSAYLYTNGKIYLYPASSWVDGIGCPAWHADGRDYVEEDVSLLAPTAVDMEGDLAALPHTFEGAEARAISGSLTVSVDTAEWKKDPRLPVTLLKSVGGPFTGEWTFNVPTDRRGSWSVAKSANGDGTESYCLSWIPNGLLLMIK